VEIEIYVFRQATMVLLTMTVAKDFGDRCVLEERERRLDEYVEVAVATTSARNLRIGRIFWYG
jgi:hypothetical protein